jgi:hypothetical protein
MNILNTAPITAQSGTKNIKCTNPVVAGGIKECTAKIATQGNNRILRFNGKCNREKGILNTSSSFSGNILLYNSNDDTLLVNQTIIDNSTFYTYTIPTNTINNVTMRVQCALGFKPSGNIVYNPNNL